MSATSERLVQILVGFMMLVATVYFSFLAWVCLIAIAPSTLFDLMWGILYLSFGLAFAFGAYGFLVYVVGKLDS